MEWKNRMKTKKTAEDVIMLLIAYSVLAIFALSTLLPFLNVLSKAISEDWAVVSGQVGIFPVGFQLGTMEYIVTSNEYLRSLWVSIVVTAIGTVIGLLVLAITAYPLSKKHVFGVKAIMVAFVFTMLFNGGMIPSYLLIKQIGLYDTIWAMILPGMMNVFNLMIIKNYYEGLPESIEESARVDGASNARILFKIIMPLSKPVYATIALFLAVYYWNNYMEPMLYINDTTLRPVQLYLRDIVLEQSDASSALGQTMGDRMNVSPEGIRSAAIIAATVPILAVYPFVQKYFVSGITIGSVKG